jgi:hypothetical protein
MMQNTNFSPRSSADETGRRQRFAELFEASPIDKRDLVYSQLSVYLSRQELSRLLVLAEIYRECVVCENGIMLEFGTCYGRTASLLSNLRGIYEPYNFTRRLVVFDTFSGLHGVHGKDGTNDLAVEGAYSSGPTYEDHLEAVLAYHESEAPIPHIRKFDIVKGNASETCPAYFRAHPEAIVALAYFDFDIYKPTRDCLDAIRPHLAKGSVVIFDQLNCPEFPGETIALGEVTSINKLRVRRSPLTPWMSYVIGEDLLG